MKCPVCKTKSLVPTILEAHLDASHCSQCNGHWISASNYWDWLDTHGERSEEINLNYSDIQVSDIQTAKLCPECSRIMLRYKVGHGTTFTLDQCGSCNGFWFDENEWEALRERNLHDEVNLVFSASWQSKIRNEEARQSLKSMYQNRLKDDYTKVKEFKEWIDSHPERELIFNYLSSPKLSSQKSPDSAIE